MQVRGQARGKLKSPQGQGGGLEPLFQTPPPWLARSPQHPPTAHGDRHDQTAARQSTSGNATHHPLRLGRTGRRARVRLRVSGLGEAKGRSARHCLIGEQPR